MVERYDEKVYVTDFASGGTVEPYGSSRCEKCLSERIPGVYYGACGCGIPYYPTVANGSSGSKDFLEAMRAQGISLVPTPEVFTGSDVDPTDR